MKSPALDFIPSLLVAVALSVAVAVFVTETGSFRDAVLSWAQRDLDARAQLAASTLKEAVSTGDFRTIHEFGANSSADGVRLTVLSAPGGIVFDSSGRQDGKEDCVFATRPCGEFRVRLGLPVSRVFAPYRRARFGFLLAGIVGATGVLFVLLFTFRQRSRMRELARERDAERRLVDELRKVEAFRRDFIADVSHEIKTPLTGIIGSADLLASSHDLPPESRDRLLKMLKSESERLNDLAQSILSLARIERDLAADSVEFSPVDVSEIVDEAVGRLDVLAVEKGVSVKVDAPGPCVVSGDGQLLSCAVSNLVINAIRHSGSRDVSVSLKRSEDSVSLTVEDHGVGIPADEQKRVFERFYRVDRSRDAGTGGSGLGLAIVRGIARLHGGDVTLEDAEPTGCRFTMTLNPKEWCSVV